MAWETVKNEVDQREAELSSELRKLLEVQPEVRTQVLTLARLEVLRAQRAALEELGRAGYLSEEVVSELDAEVTAAIDAQENGQPLQG
ncbi:MAG: hypothetical protein R3E79_36675 [Caldilineaceae bacterium]